MFKLSKKNLLEREALLLVEQIKRTSNITGYSLKEWLKFKDILVATDELGNLAGLCLYYDFSDAWTFISVLFVLDKFRNQGIGKQLFYTACNDIMKNRKRNIYTSSRNPIVIKMMKDLHFTIFETLLKLPEPYKKYEVKFMIRSLKWVMNFYRIKEITRKLLVYNSSKSFLYGIKDCHCQK